MNQSRITRRSIGAVVGGFSVVQGQGRCLVTFVVFRLIDMDTRLMRILALGCPGRETDRARKCLSLAIRCLDEVGDMEFDSCHILSGLCREHVGVAFHVLKNVGVTQGMIDDKLRRREGSRGGDFRMADDTRIVLDAAFAAAREMNHNYIGTEHLLIGATSEGVGAAMMLRAFGLSPDDVQNDVYELLGHRL